MKQGHIFTEGIIGADYSKEIKRQLDAIPADTTQIIHHISSPGGSVYGGYKGFHALKLAGKPIHSIIEGEAQSMATFLAYAGETVEILNPSVWMIHNPSQGIEGDADALENGAGELRMIEDEMANVYLAETKRRGMNYTLDEVKSMMKNETRLDAYKAKQMGFVDKVTNQLKAVAIGKNMKKEEAKSKLEKVLSAIGEAITGTTGATAIALDTADGKVLNIDAPDLAGAVSKPATIDGQPAEGAYTLKDGTVITCAAGVVQKVEMPMTDAQKALKAAEEQVMKLKTEMEAQKAAAQKAEAEAAKAKEEATKAVTALGTAKKEVEEMKKTIGTDDAPDQGHVVMQKPIGVKPEGPQAKAIDMTRTFLMENLPWLERYYPDGYFSKYKRGGPNATSILETSFGWTYDGILTTDVFYKPTLNSPALADMFTVDQGISFQKKYNLVAALNKILQPYTGCGGTANSNRALITAANLQTKEFKMYEGWCKDDFTSQLSGLYNNLAQEWLKTGNDSFDPAGTPVDKIIMNLLKDGLRRDVFRRVTMAASNSSDADYNQIDGLWDRLIDSAGAANYCVRRAGSSLGTAALSSGNALTHLETAYAASNLLLKQFIAEGKATYWVTQSIWDNLYNSYIGNGQVTEAQFANLQTGLTTLKYKGIPVRPVALWDDFLTESDNPLFGTTSHLILLTVKENHILGVESSGDLNKIESWYEMKDQKRYYRADMKFGYQYLHCDLQTIMY